MWIGINYLGSPIDPINFCIHYNIKPDAFWFDNIGFCNDNNQNLVIRQYMKKKDFANILVFGTICLKHQNQYDNIESLITSALDLCDIITTSAKNTDNSSVKGFKINTEINLTQHDIEKFELMKLHCKNITYLAVASGINDDNIYKMLSSVDIFMVNTSISKNNIFIPS